MNYVATNRFQFRTVYVDIRAAHLLLFQTSSKQFVRGKRQAAKDWLAKYDTGKINLTSNDTGHLKKPFGKSQIVTKCQILHIRRKLPNVSKGDEMTNFPPQTESETIPVPPDDFAQFLLSGRHIASLATYRQDGSIHLTAIWYLYKDGYLYFPTSSKSQKARNVAANPQAAAMIDTRVPGQEQGVSVSGLATVLGGEQGRTLVAEAQQRYLTQIALADENVGKVYAKFDDVVIALRPTRWVTWDIAKMNAERFDGKLGVESGYLYPLD
jgi:PPOX class probable F420-dependent enzyme